MYNIISQTNQKYEIPYFSSTLNLIENLIEDVNKNNEPIPLNFSDKSIKQLINIKNIKNISEECFRLIDFLDLNYLLYNHKIKLKSNIPSILELYRIKSESDEVTKIKLLIKYFRDNLKYIKIGRAHV